MTNISGIGIFGGSFDPVHNGHLHAAREVQQRLALEKILFIPCQQHAFGKLFNASPQQRLKMLELAIAGQENFAIDTRELNRPGISYMIDTLVELDSENPDETYSLIIGMDALHNLDKWHQWEEILELANIIVVNRTYLEIETINPALAQYLCTDPQEFMRSKAGKILLLSTPLLTISATQIRSEVAVSHKIDHLVPKSVADYIAAEKIYS